MLDVDFIKYIEDREGLVIHSSTPLSGGDINNVYLLKTNSKKLVLKTNKAKKFPDMFSRELEGLNALRATRAIDVPEPLGTGEFQEQSYLLLEYVSGSEQSRDFWETFGRQLGLLHQNTQDTFGFWNDNYIGSLVQKNGNEATAVAFFINQRLEPQFAMASINGFKFPNKDQFYNEAERLIPSEQPALIHGDLWGGNYLVNKIGEPCLIDPAVAFAPREMDVAMMRLFGGFDPRLFDSYNEYFPLVDGWEDRVRLWQLYYVLVHVNLFGGGYFATAKNIIQRYT